LLGTLQCVCVRTYIRTCTCNYPCAGDICDHPSGHVHKHTHIHISHHITSHDTHTHTHTQNVGALVLGIFGLSLGPLVHVGGVDQLRQVDMIMRAVHVYTYRYMSHTDTHVMEDAICCVSQIPMQVLRMLVCMYIYVRSHTHIYTYIYI
jgi:hypothetical protein